MAVDNVSANVYDGCMSDATLSREEVAIVRKLVASIGLTAAAEKLGVHRTSLAALLADTAIRPNTIAVLRTSIPKVKA